MLQAIKIGLQGFRSGLIPVIFKFCYSIVIQYRVK
jgi:hypothetical protein